MSRLNDLLRELKSREPSLARDLEREYSALSHRRAFGLNFERHVPEAVELPNRIVRKGDKVRVQPARGESKFSNRLWKILNIDKLNSTASLVLWTESPFDLLDPKSDTLVAKLEDLIVVAEFRDPIYPGIVSTGRVSKCEGKSFHSVINGENYHALETLLFTHRGKVDVIYIDPPYNTGAKDWKYNNNYVENDDLYRHSKWLAFIERRLLIAQELLKPDNSVLIISIDEKEYLRLGLLLEQTFPSARVQMVSSVINPTGAIRTNEFTRTNEMIYFVMFGTVELVPDVTQIDEDENVRWNQLRRFEMSSARNGSQPRPDQFYPIYVNRTTGRISEVGDSIPLGVDRATVQSKPGCVTLWPLKPNGTEMIWGLTPASLRSRLSQGYVKVSRNRGSEEDQFSISYLTSGKVEAIASGKMRVTGHSSDGSVIVEQVDGLKRVMPTTQWHRDSHSAQTFGTKLISQMIPGRRFPFPKSLYAVEDCLRYFVKNKPNAIILDFFAGSGTTAHAVMRLNKQDVGYRQSICITNNEVAADEQKNLREKGLRPGDPDWEKWGICEYITKPRINAAVTGQTPDGNPVTGTYKFVDEFPMSDGFEENVEFFTLTYEAPLRVASNREFLKVAPLLWMRAGSIGRRIEDISKGWDVADTYGVLADIDNADKFIEAIAQNGNIKIVYIITDEDRVFESISQELPKNVEPVRLYEAYLRNFEIESGRGSI